MKQKPIIINTNRLILKSINENIASTSVEAARKKLEADSTNYLLLKEKIEDLRQEKATLLANAGFTPKYLEGYYTCSDCKDTGYIDGNKCHCFK